jgi:polysaccharide pyruvyl transferase WcaK-like protein
VEKPTGAVYAGYLESLAAFANWLFAHDYDVRLLIGDLADRRVTKEFRSLLAERSVNYANDRVTDEPVTSVRDLLYQLASTDVVVATRFHNVLLSLVLEKPVIAISFHHKCSSLMSQMGMAEYSLDINSLNANRLIQQFRHLEEGADRVKELIREKVSASRNTLEEQYGLILRKIAPGASQAVVAVTEVRQDSIVS